MTEITVGAKSRYTTFCISTAALTSEVSEVDTRKCVMRAGTHARRPPGYTGTKITLCCFHNRFTALFRTIVNNSTRLSSNRHHNDIFVGARIGTRRTANACIIVYKAVSYTHLTLPTILRV